MTLVSVSIWLSRLGGLGKSPWAPGTVATAVAGIPAMCGLWMVPEPWPMFLLVALFFLACYVSNVTELALGEHDPGEIVIDELVGYLVTLIGLEPGIKPLVLGFILFRLFDIWKPWPVNLLNQDKGGFWVVADDVAAGFYAHGVLWIILRLWH